MNPTPVTIVTDTASDGLVAARTLVGAGFARLTAHVGRNALRTRLLEDDVPAVLVLDLFLEVTPAEELAGLALSQLDLGGAVVVAVTPDPEAAVAAGADLTVAPGDTDGLASAVLHACALRRARANRQLVRAA